MVISMIGVYVVCGCHKNLECYRTSYRRSWNILLLIVMMAVMVLMMMVVKMMMMIMMIDDGDANDDPPGTIYWSPNLSLTQKWIWSSTCALLHK